MVSEIIIIGKSQKILEAKAFAQQVAKTDVNVLLSGESGTGKEVFARYIHSQSLRAKEKFIPINCGALPQGVLESELFGHEKGSFTGALTQRKGYFESADGGTIFLDEIGEMPLETQVKLLRVLESGEYLRVGSSEARHANVRLIAATNRHLDEEVHNKRFREDLYFRLRTVELTLPPLRERGDDVLDIAETFIHDFEKKHHVKFVGFTNDATELLLKYQWAGNIRELRNVVESLIVLERDKEINAAILSKYLQTNRSDIVSTSLVPINSAKVSSLPLRITPTITKNSEPIIELIYREIMLMQADLNQMKDDIKQVKQMLFNLSNPLPSLNHKEETPLLLPTPKETKEESLRDILKSFFDQSVESGNPPSLYELERFAIEQTLKRVGGSRRKAAKSLGITERTLYRKINDYNLEKVNTTD